LENVSSPCRKKKNFPKKNQRGPSDIFSTRSHNFTRASRTKVDNNKGHIMAQCAFNWCLLSMFKCRVSMILPSLASTRPVCAPGSKTWHTFPVFGTRRMFRPPFLSCLFSKYRNMLLVSGYWKM
jgi:hypothetical protein